MRDNFGRNVRFGIRAGAVLYISIWLVAICLFVGWVKNIVSFVGSDFEAPYKSEIVRAVGIPIAPMGGIIGYMTIGDEE